MSKQLISDDVMGVWYVFMLLFLLNQSAFHGRTKLYMRVNLGLNLIVAIASIDQFKLFIIHLFIYKYVIF